MLFDGLEWITCGLLWGFYQLFGLWYNFDGTHSLERIHWWASDTMLHFSKSVLMKKQMYPHFGWPEGGHIFITFSCLGDHALVNQPWLLLCTWLYLWKWKCVVHKGALLLPVISIISVWNCVGFVPVPLCGGCSRWRMIYRTGWREDLHTSNSKLTADLLHLTRITAAPETEVCFSGQNDMFVWTYY